MGDLAEWLSTATRVGYILGGVGVLLLLLDVLDRIGDQITWRGAPAAAAEKPDGDGGERYRALVVVMGIAAAVAAGVLAVVVRREGSGLLGDRVVSWVDAGMLNGLLLVLAGSGIAWWGLRRLRDGDRGAFNPGSLGNKLIAWNAAPAGDVADLERRVSAYERSLGAATTVAVGLAIVVAGVAVSAIALMGDMATTGAPVWFTNVLYLAQLVGTGIGYPIAAHLEQRKVPPGRRYADLRRRRLADYRSPRLRWPVLAVIAFQSAAAGMFLLVAGVPVALLMPAFGALVFAVGELHMWSAARVARMVVTDDPETARRCDDLVRAQVIARLQQWQYFNVAYAGFIGAYVAAAYGRSGASGILLAASFASVGLCLLCALGVLALEERMGGRITGWWGQPMPQ